MQIEVVDIIHPPRLKAQFFAIRKQNSVIVFFLIHSKYFYVLKRVTSS